MTPRWPANVDGSYERYGRRYRRAGRCFVDDRDQVNLFARCAIGWILLDPARSRSIQIDSTLCCCFSEDDGESMIGSAARIEQFQSSLINYKFVCSLQRRLHGVETFELKVLTKWLNVFRTINYDPQPLPVAGRFRPLINEKFSLKKFYSIKFHRIQTSSLEWRLSPLDVTEARLSLVNIIC